MARRRSTSRKKTSKGKKAGLPPGTLVYTGQKRIEVPDLSVIAFTADNIYTSKSLKDVVFPVIEGVLWIDIRGLHETELVRELGSKFGIHPLALEDIVDISQRPKFDHYDEGFLILMEAYTFNPDELRMVAEQISIYCGKGFVLSFQEDAKDIFPGIRDRLNFSQGRIRRYGTDYLTYALIDDVVDRYFVTLEAVSDIVESLEIEISENPSFETKNKIHMMKRAVIEMRRGMTPLRDAMSMLMRSDSNLISDNTSPYLQDLYGNVLQVIEMTDTNRDILSGLQDLYLSEISYRMNKVMQTLTIVATIFIPLTFVAGIYGMNFDHMPELHWKNGYFMVWGVMILISAILLLLFRRNKWL